MTDITGIYIGFDKKSCLQKFICHKQWMQGIVREIYQYCRNMVVKFFLKIGYYL